MTRRHASTILLTAALVSAVLAACGGSSGGSSSGPPSNGLSSKSPTQILAAVQAATAKLQSVHVVGTLASGGQTIKLDMSLGKNGADGSLDENGLSFQLIVINGTAYLKGSKAFLAKFAGSAASLFAGKWLKFNAGTPNSAQLTQLGNINALFGKVLHTTSTVTKGTTTTLNGQPVVELISKAKGGTMYIAGTGPAYPLQLTKSGAGGGTVRFDQFNQALHLTPPAGALDVSALS